MLNLSVAKDQLSGWVVTGLALVNLMMIRSHVNPATTLVFNAPAVLLLSIWGFRDRGNLVIWSSAAVAFGLFVGGVVRWAAGAQDSASVVLKSLTLAFGVPIAILSLFSKPSEAGRKAETQNSAYGLLILSSFAISAGCW